MLEYFVDTPLCRGIQAEHEDRLPFLLNDFFAEDFTHKCWHAFLLIGKGEYDQWCRPLRKYDLFQCFVEILDELKASRIEDFQAEKETIDHDDAPFLISLLR